jgi:hypothetical protein
VVDRVHFRFLVTIVGRPALGLKCKVQGHKSFECPVKKYCHYWSIWGHASGECKRKGTYAGRLSPKTGMGSDGEREVAAVTTDPVMHVKEGRSPSEGGSSADGSQEQVSPSHETRSTPLVTPSTRQASTS